MFIHFAFNTLPFAQFNDYWTNTGVGWGVLKNRRSAFRLGRTELYGELYSPARYRPVLYFYQYLPAAMAAVFVIVLCRLIVR